MLQNYLKIALRSLWRSKIHTLINILGLGLGVACCILIVLYVRDEWTYDQFHSKADRIYRVYAREDWGENQKFFATITPLPMGPALKDNFPEVDKHVRINPVGSVVDDLCIIKSIYTEAINHDPAITFFQTGNQLPGRPSMGSWVSYGLGTDNKNLPAFIVLISKNASKDQPLYARLWGNGFLPSEHQGVQFRSGKDPVLFLENPAGYDHADRKEMLDYLTQLNQLQNDPYGDPEVDARIAQYEMAYRMQTSVPEVMDISKEPDEVFDMYGPDSRDPGTYAANCILARKLLEKDVKFVQLYHQGWDHHGGLPSGMQKQCKDVDQPTAAFVKDLKRRGLLEDTLVIWGGEFGRTVYSQGKLLPADYGRDHHPRCFTMWMAGAGVKAGISYGETDDFSYNIVKDPVHVHDFHATIMHLMGVDHERLTYKFQGRRFRLTDVSGNVVNDLLA